MVEPSRIKLTLMHQMLACLTGLTVIGDRYHVNKENCCHSENIVSLKSLKIITSSKKINNLIWLFLKRQVQFIPRAGLKKYCVHVQFRSKILKCFYLKKTNVPSKSVISNEESKLIKKKPFLRSNRNVSV